MCVHGHANACSQMKHSRSQLDAAGFTPNRGPEGPERPRSTVPSTSKNSSLAASSRPICSQFIKQIQLQLTSAIEFFVKNDET